MGCQPFKPSTHVKHFRTPHMNDTSPPLRHWSITEVARRLISSNALASIKTQDAIVLAQRMRLCQITGGAVLFKNGDTNTDFMALVLEGEAVVENMDTGAGDGMVLSVVAAGNIIGEMGVVANAPRSATVTASGDMVVAILDQAAFAQLIAQKPAVACGFLSSLLHGVTDRLRESNRKLLTLTKINQSMFNELEASRENESHLAELFVSASNFGTLQPAAENSQDKNSLSETHRRAAQNPLTRQPTPATPTESLPPEFTRTHPV